MVRSVRLSKNRKATQPLVGERARDRGTRPNAQARLARERASKRAASDSLKPRLEYPRDTDTRYQPLLLLFSFDQFHGLQTTKLSVYIICIPLGFVIYRLFQKV